MLIRVRGNKYHVIILMIGITSKELILQKRPCQPREHDFPKRQFGSLF